MSALGIDWAEVRRRMAEAEQALAQGLRPSAEKAQEILRARARALAGEKETERIVDALEIVAFLLGQESYGVESRFVREVCPLVELTPLPGTPPFVLGIMNVRGRILSVIDIGKLFDLPLKGIGDMDRAIVISTGGMEFGLLGNAVVGVQLVPRGELQPPLPTMTGNRGSYLLGITRQRMAVLNAVRLLSSEEIVVRADA